MYRLFVEPKTWITIDIITHSYDELIQHLENKHVFLIIQKISLGNNYE